MKTNLPQAINTVPEAEAFLEQLYINNEVFHPEDDAFDIRWGTTTVSDAEKTQLNKLTDEMYSLPEIDTNEFCPCGYSLQLQRNYLFASFMTNNQEELNTLKQKANRAGCIDSMKYHSDWAWLMPVVEKISNQVDSFIFGYNGEGIATITNRSRNGRTIENTTPLLIEAVYFTAHEYIVENI